MDMEIGLMCLLKQNLDESSSRSWDRHLDIARNHTTYTVLLQLVERDKRAGIWIEYDELLERQLKTDGTQPNCLFWPSFFTASTGGNLNRKQNSRDNRIIRRIKEKLQKNSIDFSKKSDPSSFCVEMFRTIFEEHSAVRTLRLVAYSSRLVFARKTNRN